MTGIDITQSSIDICKKRSAFYKFNIPLYRMSAEKLEFPDQNFDIVYSFGVLHHLPNTENAIHEINRVLKKGGVAIIRVNAKGWWYYGRILFWQGFLQGRLFKMSKQEVINKNTLVEGESPLVKFFNRKEVKQLFVDFKIQRIRKYYLGANFCFLPYWLREEVLGRLFGNHWMIEVRN